MPLVAAVRAGCLRALLVFMACATPGAGLADETVRIGVLAKRGFEQVYARWSATADYLNREIPGYTFTLVPLDFDQVYPAVSGQAIDFVLTNSGMYVELEAGYGASRIVTLRNLGPDGSAHTRFGGVLFTRADRSDIKDLDDLRGRRVMAVDELSLGGFWMAWRELHAAGIDPYRDFAELRFGNTHDAVVHAVLNGEVDAGTVRSDTLERMAAEGRLGLDQVRVVAPAAHAGFRFLTSTRLYPEWPFAKLEHTSEALGDRVAAALLALPPDSEAARAARITGWTVPHNYQPVHDLMRELRVGPYATADRVTFEAVWRQYGHWMAAAGLVLLVMLAGNGVVGTLNRRLRRTEGELREARDNLAAKVDERTAELRVALGDLEESHRRLDLARRDWNDAFDAILDPIFIHDEAMRVVHANPAYAERAGVAADELIGRVYWELFPPIGRPLAACAQFPEQIVAQGEEVVLPGGEVFVSRSFGMKGRDGQMHNAIHILKDVTAERRAEGRRRTLSRAVEQSGEGVALLDAGRTVAYANPALCRLAGVGEAELVARGADGLVTWREGDPQVWQHVAADGGWAGEATLAGGTPVYATVSDLHDETGRIEGYVITVFDLSAIKRVEGELQHRVRFENVLGQLAAQLLGAAGVQVDAALDQALGRLGEVVEVDRVCLFEYRPQTEEARKSHAWSRPGYECPEARAAVFSFGACRWLGERLRRMQIVEVADVDALPPEAAAEREALAKRSTRSMLAVPLAHGETFTGFLAFDSVRAPRPAWAPDDVQLLRTAGGILASAIRRRAAEEAVRHSQASLAAAQAIAHLGNWDWDVVTNELAWSDEIYRIFGVLPQEFGATYDAFLGYVHPDDREHVITAVNRALHEREPYGIDHRIVLGDGSERVVHEMGEVSFGAHGEPVRMIGTVQDVTEARRAERELKRLNRALRTLSRVNGTLVHSTDEEQLLGDVCHLLVEVGGFRFAWVGYPESGPGRPIRPIASAGFEQGYLSAVEFGWGDGPAGQGPTGTALRTGKTVVSRDISTDTAFGPWREEALARGYASVIALPLVSDGEAVGVLTIDAMEPDAFDAREVELLTELAGDLAFGIRTLRNEAERRRAEAALHASESRYHDLYDTAPTGYASVRAADGLLVQCNTAFAQLLGYTREALCNRPVFSLYAEGADGRGRAAEVFRRFIAGHGVKDVELQMLRADGSPLWVSLSVEPVRDAGGRVVESRSSIIDISARKAAEVERQRFAERLERSLLQTIEAISLTIEKRDPYTAGHQQRVAELASAIAAEMGLEPARIEGLRLGALIHDIGKVYVPAEILNRPGKLDAAQFVLIKSHPQVGYDIVKGIEFPWPLADFVVQHHERLDGSGYPQGLADGAILLEARILAVADVVEAMASHRPYRAALPLATALAEIEKNSGNLYDRAVVAVCLRLFREKAFRWTQGSG